MIFAANTLHDVLSLTESQRPHPSTWNPDPETTNCYYMYVPPSRKGRGGGAEFFLRFSYKVCPNHNFVVVWHKSEIFGMWVYTMIRQYATYQY